MSVPLELGKAKMESILDKLIIPLLLLACQLWLNARFKRADQKRDNARKETEERLQETLRWRSSIEELICKQDKRVDTILTAQCTQMRSDIIHKAHRYMDDLGCAGMEEKQSFWAEYEEYQKICAENEIVNHFVDKLAERVMALPDRKGVDNADGE